MIHEILVVIFAGIYIITVTRTQGNTIGRHWYVSCLSVYFTQLTHISILDIKHTLLFDLPLLSITLNSGYEILTTYRRLPCPDQRSRLHLAHPRFGIT